MRMKKIIRKIVFVLSILLCVSKVLAQNNSYKTEITEYLNKPSVFNDSLYLDVKSSTLLVELRKTISIEKFDIHLLNAGIFYYTNEYRIKKNKAVLQFSAELRDAALYHALQMNVKNFYNHFNPYNKKMKEPYDRMKYFGFSGEYCGENIDKAFMMNYIDGKPYDGDFKTKQFYYITDKKESITFFTYQELAQNIVDDWIASKPHQKNMLDANYLYLGCAVMIDNKSLITRDLPRIYAVQNFGGEKGNNPYSK